MTKRAGRRLAASRSHPETLRRARLRELFLRVRLELPTIDVEGSDAFSELVGAHGVFVVEPAEGLLVEGDALDVGGLRLLDAEAAWQLAVGGAELLQEIRADRQEVTAGEHADLIRRRKRGQQGLRGSSTRCGLRLQCGWNRCGGKCRQHPCNQQRIIK